MSAVGSNGAPARTLGWPRTHLRLTDSTNARARELAIAGAPDGTLVTASAQSAGRGRHGRRWWAPPGSSLLMSLILRPPPPLLPLSAAVAVCDAAGEEALIKWPNDIVLPSRSPARAAAGPRRSPGGEAPARREALRKLAGILVEGRLQDGWAVLGIGMNVAVREQDIPPELSAATLGRAPEAIEPLLGRLLAALERRIVEPRQATLTAWRARDALLDREIIWEEPRAGAAAGGPARAGGELRGGAGVPPAGSPFARGRAAGIDGGGRLLVALADGTQTALDSGEVRLLG